MRVVRTTTKGITGAPRKGGRAGAAGFEPAGPRAAGGGAVAATGMLGSIDALGVLQGVDGADADAGPAAAAARGGALLDDLEALRDGLLAGELDDGALADLGERLQTRRRERLEPGLAAILDDIELRAAVELAKRERAAEAPAPAAAPEPSEHGGGAGEAAVRARRAYGATPSVG
jgi:hypothetical protein